MNLYLRLLIVTISSLWRARLCSIRDVARLRFRVLPNDLDLNGHMNNSRYLTIMDLGRFDLILRVGPVKLMVEKKYMPILAAAKIRWRLPLMPFQSYFLDTHVVCWDEKWIFMEQRFIIANGPKAGAVAAIAIVKGGFFDKRLGTTAPTDSVLDALSMQEKSPAFPAHIIEWQKAEESLRTVTAAETQAQDAVF